MAYQNYTLLSFNNDFLYFIFKAPRILVLNAYSLNKDKIGSKYKLKRDIGHF